MKVAGILLAAGESTRMGRLKALLPWRGTTLLRLQAAALLAAGAQPAMAVLGHRWQELAAILSEPLDCPWPDIAPEAWAGHALRAAINPRFREGKSTSVITGIRALPPEASGAIVLPVDQPCTPSVLRALIAAHGVTRAPIVLPSVDRRRGHPPLFDRALFPELLAITEEGEGVREVLTKHASEIHYVELDEAIVRANLNTPADYQAAFDRWGR